MAENAFQLSNLVRNGRMLRQFKTENKEKWMVKNHSVFDTQE
jgi:hypothetical protein